jgi:hypothetical protein
MIRLRNAIGLSLAEIGLALICYLAASYFHDQYAEANGVIHRAVREAKARGDTSLPSGLPSAERYFQRAEMMFYLCLFVFACSLALAFGMRHWIVWLAVLMVGIITAAMPLHLLWRS